jgi:hypothetical protein
MNPIIEYYQCIYHYLYYSHPSHDVLERILELAEVTSPSWKATEEKIIFLERCTDSNEDDIDSELWHTTLDDFATLAFKDLSVLKNPAAMDIFHKLVDLTIRLDGENNHVIWAKSIRERPDGSGIIVLHVSNLEAYRGTIDSNQIVGDSTELKSLENGILLPSPFWVGPDDEDF